MSALVQLALITQAVLLTVLSRKKEFNKMNKLAT